jgi:hypothetical protein
MTAMRKSFDELFKYIHKAESLIPEEFRRLCMTYHDVHDIRNGYVELGLEVPVYLDRVVELVSDKFKHAVADLEAEGGHFYKARKAVVARGDYRYDHSIPLLAADKQKEHEDETGSSKS